MNYKVYEHRNKINGKRYIGITGYENPNDRWRNGLGYKPYGKKSVSHLYHAIKKYGWDSFESRILYDNLSYKSACIKEVELISKYNSNNPKYGYNKHEGGLNGMPLTEEAKLKISEANKGIKNGMYGRYGENHPMYGRVHSSQTKSKMSKARKGKKPWNKGKTGIYSSETLQKISEAHKGHKYNLGKKHTQETKELIGKNTKKQWEREEFRKMVSDANKGNKNNGKKVICGEVVFDTIKECAEHLGVHWKTLSRWLNGIRNIPTKYTHLNIRYENTEVN